MATAKMRKLALDNYPVVLNRGNGKKDTIWYEMAESAAGLLMLPQRQLTGLQLLKAAKIADAIREAGEKGQEDILLDEAQWNELRTAAETVRGLGQNEVEMLRRIVEAPQVDVEEAKKE